MNKLLRFFFVLMLVSTQIHAQKVDIEVSIDDDFLRMPITGVKVSVLNTDHTVVVDSASSVSIMNTKGRLLQEIYVASVNAGKKNYIIRATKLGYNDVLQPVSVLSTQTGSVKAPTIKMRKERNVDLKEVVVKSTKIKMFYKGDTLVYNADAFKLPDGSMLDALIRQLPGVTMDSAGQIFVNGRKVDELLLGSRSFMHGNKKVLMENLPYYTVNKLKVYEKRTAKSEALGYDADPSEYVMDVNLKDEYRQGYVANVEAAGGTESRWLQRGFLLGFTDQWRYTLLDNLNNVNESRHIGEQGYWSPTSMPQSLFTTRSVATDLDYQSKDKNANNNFNAVFTSTTTQSEMHQHYEQFLAGSKPTSQTENHQKSDNWNLKLFNHLELKKPAYFSFTTQFDYGKWDASGLSQFQQWNEDLTAIMRTNALSKGRNWAISQDAQGTLNINREKHWFGTYFLIFRHSDDQSWLSNRYDTWHQTMQNDEIRYNASDVSNRLTNFLLKTDWTFGELFGKVNLIIGDQLNYSDNKTHDYLYHPDSLLLASQLDLLTVITDASNSYDSHHRQWTNTADITLSKQASYKMGLFNITYDRWRVDLNFPVYHQSLNYQRGIIDTLTRNTSAFFTPSASFRHMSAGGKHDFRMSARFDSAPADLLNQIGFRDDSQPLVVKVGNPGLKGTAATNVNIDYSQKDGKRIKQWHVGATFNYNHRDVAQSVIYNPSTGVYLYQPKNITGAYLATSSLDVSSDIGEKRYWTWQMNTEASYNHSLDYAMLTGETESRENAVNTTVLHNGSYIQYSKDAFNLRASGDIRWRHSEGKMVDFSTLNVFDYRYGLTARYTVPVLKTTVSADGNMYSRSGYGSNDLNTDDFVLNASVSQSLLKGKLIASIEAFDLLHQLSNTQYEVNAQGRTETWYRSLPHYVMIHIVYHWNKNPNKR